MENVIVLNKLNMDLFIVFELLFSIISVLDIVHYLYSMDFCNLLHLQIEEARLGFFTQGRIILCELR